MRNLIATVLVLGSVLLTQGLWGCSRQTIAAVSSTHTSEETDATFVDNSQRIAKPVPQGMQGATSEDMSSSRQTNLEKGKSESQEEPLDSKGGKQAHASLGLSRGELPQRDVPPNAASSGKDDQQEFRRRPPPELQVIENWRAQAEEYVRLLKVRYPRDSDQYREAERRYIGVKVKFDAWLNRLVMDLNNNISQSPRFKDLLEAAYTKYLAFRSYVDSLLANTKTPVMGLQSPLDSKTLEDAAIRLWQGYSTAKQSRDLIAAHLRQLEWKDFDRI
jgi:hypothetical protein